MGNKNTSGIKTQDTAKIWPAITIVGVIAYVIIDIVLTFLRPDYNWLHNAESDYGRGPYFWLMDINFLLRCLLTLALAKALLINYPKNKSIKQTTFWLILWAVMSGLLVFFADNPYGYPKLRSGPAHLLIAFVAFTAALIAMILFSRAASAIKMKRVNSYLLIGLTFAAVVSFFLIGHAGFRPNSLGGLYERIFLASVLVWETVLARFILTENKLTNA